MDYTGDGIPSFRGRYEFLSMFSPSPLKLYSPIIWPDGEHAFQAFKTLDMMERLKIADLPTAYEAKAAGRRVQLRPDWEAIKKRVMFEVNLAKFTQNPDLAAQLNATGDHPLVERNRWHDNYWGDCQCGRSKCAGQGRNHLGRLLEMVRYILRADS